MTAVLKKIYVDALNECNYGFDRQWTRSTVYESVGSLAEQSDDDLLYSESESADRSGSFVESLERATFSDHDEELDNKSIVSRKSSSSSFTVRTWSSVNSNPIHFKEAITYVPPQLEGA